MTMKCKIKKKNRDSLNRNISFLLFLACFGMGLFGCAWNRPQILTLRAGTPDDLGVTDGKFAPCPKSPNCVSTQTDTKRHYIEPIHYTIGRAGARAALLQSIKDIRGSYVVKDSDTYLYAQFQSPLAGFVDDAEFYIDDENKVIHMRSKARLGWWDFSKNRKRIEEIRQKFTLVEPTYGD